MNLRDSFITDSDMHDFSEFSDNEEWDVVTPLGQTGTWKFESDERQTSET